MTRWLHGSIHGSMRRWLLACQLGALALCALAVVAVQAWQVSRALAARQDAALAHALRAPAEAEAGMTFRTSARSGERLAGDAALAPCPWPGTLPADGSADLYVGVLRGRLVRVAAALQAGPAGTEPVVLQAALPWAARWPSAAQLFDAGVRTLLALLGVLALAAVLLAQAASAWLRRLHAALQGAQAPVPAELAPLVDSAREVLRSNREWVDRQRDFLADASHQLRTPLAVLRTQLQTLQGAGRAAADAVPAMLQTVDRATLVANQLLGLKRLDQLRSEGASPPTVALWPVCRDAAVELSPLVLAKRLDFGLDEFELLIHGDPTLLGELVRNLLANAIHHAPPGGRIGIVLRHCADRRELIVWDEGPGIDDALRPRLFHPFAAGSGGTGLGLSICRQIAEASGASIALFNRIDGGQVVGVDAVVSWGQGP